MGPSVTVVIIAYNTRDFVEVAIDSVLRQTFRQLELVVVEDGSDDGTRALVAGIDDPRVRYLRQENAGPSAARNLGIRASSGELIAFLDSDDWWEPAKLERQVAALSAHPECGWAFSGARQVTEFGQVMDEGLPQVSGHVLRHMLPVNCVTGSSSSVIVRRRLLESVGGFDETLRYSEDWDLWLRLAASSPVCTVREIDVNLLSRQNSAGKKTELIRQGARFVVERAFATIAKSESDLRRFAISRIEATASVDHATLGNRGAALKALGKAIILAPTHVPYYKRLVLAALGRV